MTKMNLSGISLKNTNLSGVSLAGAQLSLADFSGSDLSNADLTKSDLRGANLMYSILVSAVLSPMPIRSKKGDLVEREMPANLMGSDLLFADLSGSLFFEANLSKADLRSTIRKRTKFTGAKLDGALVTK